MQPGTLHLPGSAVEWLRSPGCGSVHQLAVSTAAASASVQLAKAPLKDQQQLATEPLKTASTDKHVPRLGLLTTWSFRSAESCAGCGQHIAFCACPSDMRLSAAGLDPRSPRKTALTARPLSLRSLLSDIEAEEARSFELAKQAQGKALELAKHNATPTPSPVARRVTINTNPTVYEHPHKDVSPEQVADALLNIRRRRRSTAAVIQHTAAAAEPKDRSWRIAEPELAETSSAEIIERYFDSVKEQEAADEAEAEEIAANIETIHQTLLTRKTKDSESLSRMLPSSLPVPVVHNKIVKSESLVFEDAYPTDSKLSSSAPEC